MREHRGRAALMRHCLLFGWTAGLCWALAGCSAKPKADTRPHETAEAKQPEKHPIEAIGKVTGKGWYLPWYRRDPNRPKGPMIPVLIANAERGEITNRDGNPDIIMRTVHARLYQKGRHSADVDAGTVEANQNDNHVVGSDGCRIHSLINPSDTVLTADRIEWDVDSSLFTATGHAHVERRPRNGVPIIQEGGTIVYSAERDTVEIR